MFTTAMQNPPARLAIGLSRAHQSSLFSRVFLVICHGVCVQISIMIFAFRITQTESSFASEVIGNAIDVTHDLVNEL
jgi:hypothetical protein